jgi:hypothetical protein
MKPEGITDFKGSYEDYLLSQGVMPVAASSSSRNQAPKEKLRMSSR